MSSQVTVFIQALPQVLDFIIVSGVVAGAILGIMNLWKRIRPNFSIQIQLVKESAIKQISDVKHEIGENISDTKRELMKEIEDLYQELEKLEDRANKMERELASIDINQIYRRFDKVENKLDDVTKLIIDQIKAKAQ